MLQPRFLFLLWALLLFSCGKRTVTTCTPLPSDGELWLRVVDMDFRMPYWEVIDSATKASYRTTDGSATDAQLQSIVHWLGLPQKKLMKSLVIYGDSIITDGSNLTKEQVLGCQYYYVMKGQLMQSFYLMQAGRLSLVPALTGAVNGISFNLRQDLYELYFRAHHREVVAWDFTNDAVIFRRNGRNEVSKKIWQLQETGATNQLHK